MSLLPPSIQASKSLSAISELAKQEMATLRDLADVLRIMDIDHVPAVLLPYLAWQFRAEGFEPSMPEDVQRQAVKKALEIHRYKGTCFAIEQVLSNVGVKADIKEWFEQSPVREPHTFTVAAPVSNNIFWDSARIKKIKHLIDSHKRLSTKFDFGLTIDAGKTGIGQAQTARLATHERIDSRAGTEIKAGQTGIGQAQTARLATHERIDSRAGTEIKAGQTGIGQAQTARLITHERITAQAGADINVNALLFRAASGTTAQIVIMMRLG